MCECGWISEALKQPPSQAVNITILHSSQNSAPAKLQAIHSACVCLSTYWHSHRHLHYKRTLLEDMHKTCHLWLSFKNCFKHGRKSVKRHFLFSVAEGYYMFGRKRDRKRERVPWHETNRNRRKWAQREGVMLRALWPQYNLQESWDRHVVAIWPGLPLYYTSWIILKCYY